MMGRRLLAVSVAIVVLLGFGAPAAPAAQRSPALQALIKAAEGEKTLDLSWAPASIGGSRGAARAQAEMNKMFGTHIRIVFTPGGMMPALSAQLAREVAAGQPAFTDVFLGASSFMSDLVFKYHVFQKASYTKYLPGRITNKISEQDGRAIKLVTSLSGVSYNKSIVPYPPKSIYDFLKPEWKGKIGSTPYAAGFDQLGASIGVKATLDFATKLTTQLSGLLRCNEAQRLASGEFGALVFDCNPHYIDKAKAAGAPLAFAYMKEIKTIDFFYLGVPKNAQHPNLAKLYVVFMETPEGQQLLWDTWRTNLSLYPETQVHKDVLRMEKATGRRPIPIDLAWHHAHPELSHLSHQVSKILTSARR